MNLKTLSLLLLCGFVGSMTHAKDRPLTPFERIQQAQNRLEIEVTEANANDLIPRILERTGLQYTFIRSAEERIISLNTQADATLALETVALAAGFNIHKNGNYWVIHPLPLETNLIN